MGTWLRAHGTTAAAVVLGVVLSVPYAWMAVADFTAARDPSGLDSEFLRNLGSIGARFTGGAATSAEGDGVSTALLFIALFETAVLVVVGIVRVGVTLRHQHSRETGLVVFTVIGVVAIAVSTSGVAADPPAPGAWIGMLSGLGALGVASLLWAPRTARDFLDKEMARLHAEFVNRNAVP
jgi:hypothetical protein